MLRNLDMPSVQKVASGESGRAAQILGMDEIKRRAEMLGEMEAKQGERQMQEPALVDQYLAMSQQIMGQPAQLAPQAPPIQSQGGIMGMMPQDQMQPQMDAPTQMMYGGGSVRKFQTGGGIPPQAEQQMKSFNLYNAIRLGELGDKEEIIRKIQQEAIRQGVDPNLAVATAMAESGLKPTAKSPKGAQGLFQLMPSTQAELGVSDPFNVDENIAGGVSYIAKMAERFDRPEDAIRAYNWGQGNMGKYLSGDASVGRIPEETKDYLTRVQTIENLLGYNPIVDDYTQTAYNPDGVGYFPAPDLTMQNPPEYSWLRGYEDLGIPQDTLRALDLAEQTTPGAATSYLEGISKKRKTEDPEFIAQVEEEVRRQTQGESTKNFLGLFPGSPRELKAEELRPQIREAMLAGQPVPGRAQNIADPGEDFAPPGPSPITEYGAINFDAPAGSEGKKDTTTKDSSNMLKSGKLQPLFDAMLRGGLEFASGKNIGEAGIAGLNQATTLAQQRRENARKNAAEKLAERVGESTIALNEARAESLGNTYYQAAEIAQRVLSKDPNFLSATPEEQQRLLSDLISSIQSRGLGGGISGIPANTERFNAAFGAM